MDWLQRTFEILGSLGLFFFGLKVLSDAILRLKGNRLRTALQLLTKNRYSGAFTGTLITALIQSSSATTVLVVSFVHAGLLKLREGVSVIMGANLGSSITFWAVALLGFKFKITLLIMPAITVGIPLLFSKEERKRKWGEAAIGFGVLFLGLDLLKNAIPDLTGNPEDIAFLAQFTGYGYATYLGFILVGLLMTAVVQSSSATGAVTLIMAYRGWIDYSVAAAVVLGADIGTTVTAHLAALNANVEAKRAARAHLLFNLIGVAWMLVVFGWFLDVVDWLVPGPITEKSLLPVHLAAFHSLFKAANLLLLLPFLDQLVALSVRLVPQRQAPQSSEPLILDEAQAEIQHMSELIVEMFQRFERNLSDPEPEMNDELQDARDQEKLTDRIQTEVSKRLIEHSFGLVAQELVLALVDLRLLDQLESMGDRIWQLMRKLDKRQRRELDLGDLSELRQRTRYVGQLLGEATAALSVGRNRKSEAWSKTQQETVEALRQETQTLPKDTTAQRLYRGMLKDLYKTAQSCLLILQTLKTR